MTKKITHQRLYNIALYYLSRYDSCTSKVRDMLKRRILKDALVESEVPLETNEWIEDIIKRLQELGYIDDQRYVQNQVRILSNAGKSAKFIKMKLQQIGIDTDFVDVALDEYGVDDLLRARALVKRKKMGYLRSENRRMDYYKKDLATLGRAGFSYEISRQALKNEDNL
ncbi:MAG: regulatory protein RecX [Alphaproteobacteria bacterium]|nr:regulatory protein RecX [Alphaproteobacteria bacterium]